MQYQTDSFNNNSSAILKEETETIVGGVSTPHIMEATTNPNTINFNQLAAGRGDESDGGEAMISVSKCSLRDLNLDYDQIKHAVVNCDLNWTIGGQSSQKGTKYKKH